jgi:hypothetical protein
MGPLVHLSFYLIFYQVRITLSPFYRNEQLLGGSAYLELIQEQETEDGA